MTDRPVTDSPATAAPRRRLAGPSSQGPAEELIEAGFAWEIGDAPLLHHGLNLADLAHVLDLHRRRILPDSSTTALLRALLRAYRTEVEDFPYDARFGEPYNSRERWLVERIGDDAGWMHAGRPRREAARVALRLLLRRLAAELIVAVGRFAEETADVAERHRDVFMPDQTYLQQAQPSSFGHYLLGFVPPALRDLERLDHVLGHLDASPGGAGCVNGSRLLDDRGPVADLLGFPTVIEHTRDAMWQTDGFIDVMSTCVSVLSNQAKLAEDLEIWSSQEFDYVDLAGPYTRASVLMPQKRNPYALSIVRGASGILIGRLAGFLAVVKSPSARSDNLIFAYGEIPRAMEFTTKVTALTTGVVRTLTVNRERMAAALDDGFSQATDLAEHIMGVAGIDYRSAYRVVGEVVRRASRAGLAGREIDSSSIDEASLDVIGRTLDIPEGGLAEVLDPRRIVETRTAEGGAAPPVVADMAARMRRAGADAARRGTGALERFAAVERDLVRRAEDLAGA